MQNSIAKFFIKNPKSYNHTNISAIIEELKSLDLTGILPKSRQSLENFSDAPYTQYNYEVNTWLNYLPKPLEDAFRQTALEQSNKKLNISNSSIDISKKTTTSPISQTPELTEI